MKIQLNALDALASLLESERKRQKLTRAQAAAVCNVSPSFIRDAETQPERCTLGKLVQLVNGLGLTMTVASRMSDASIGIIAGALQGHRNEGITDVLKVGLPEPRATDELRQTSGAGIINSARRVQK